MHDGFKFVVLCVNVLFNTKFLKLLFYTYFLLQFVVTQSYIFREKITKYV